MTPALRAALAAGLLAAALTGCTSGSSTGAGPDVPAEDAFTEGTCRAAAPDVRAVGQALPRLGDGGSVDTEVRASLREAQERLRALTEGSEAELQPVLAELTQKIGLVRIRADGNTYEPSLGETLTGAYEDVLRVCTDSESAN